MKKRVLSIFLMGVMLTSLLFGCGNNGNENQNLGNGKENEQSNAEEKANPDDSGKALKNEALKGVSMKVGSYNICKCENWSTYLETEEFAIDVAKITEAIERLGVDICGLQEVLHEDELVGQAQEIADALGWFFAFTPALKACPDGRNTSNMYGNAIISRFPIVSCRSVAICASEKEKTMGIWKGDYYEDRILLIAELDIDGEILTVMNTHMGLQESEKNIAIQVIEEELAKATTPVILMGDLNMTSDDERIGRLNELFKDTAENSDETIFTFPAENPDRKIDYIFIPKNSTVHSISTIESLASDHLPFIAEIEF